LLSFLAEIVASFGEAVAAWFERRRSNP